MDSDSTFCIQYDMRGQELMVDSERFNASVSRANTVRRDETKLVEIWIRVSVGISEGKTIGTHLYCRPSPSYPT
jgi:hypothetical protein